MESINAGKLIIRPLKLHNVYDLREWEHYNDPLFFDYNFPDLDDYEVKRWFDTRVSQISSKSFAITLRETTIGLINIKNIRKILKVANLGIVFNPKFINKGYGTTALKAMLRYYFETMNMRALYLDVAKHNKRAIRTYEKCGFKKVKEFTIKLEGIDLEDIPSNYWEEDFVVKERNVYIYCYKMRISKLEYKNFM